MTVNQPIANVIGAGPGGLAAALQLASRGVEVHVFERQGRVGGRTSAIEEAGFRFDVGPTFFMYPQALDEIFQSVGLSLRDEVDLVKLDPQYDLHFEQGGRILATPDMERLEREVAAISPGDVAGLRRFFEDNRRKLDAFIPVLKRPFGSIKDAMDPALLRALPVLRPWNSLDRDLKRFFSDPRIRLAFSFQSKYLGMSPFRCPSLFSILSFLEYEHGVFHPIGGCAALTEKMAEIAESMGVQIHLNEGVEELIFEGHKAVGLRSSSGLHRADSVVVNADFAAAMQRMVPDRLRRKWTDRKLAKKKYSCSTFMLYLGIEGRYDHLEHHTIFMSKDYERNLDEIENRHVLSENPSFYVQNPSVTDPTLAPAGKSGLYVLVPVTHQHENVDWSVERQRYRDLTIQRLKAVGLHDLEERIVYEKVVTPADWEHGHHIHRGATFNLAHSFDQMLHRRPNNRFEDLENVYLVGGGTHPGSGLPVIFESAKISSRLMLEDFGIADSAPYLEAPAYRPAMQREMAASA